MLPKHAVVVDLGALEAREKAALVKLAAIRAELELGRAAEQERLAHEAALARQGSVIGLTLMTDTSADVIAWRERYIANFDEPTRRRFDGVEEALAEAVTEAQPQTEKRRRGRPRKNQGILTPIETQDQSSTAAAIPEQASASVENIDPGAAAIPAECDRDEAQANAEFEGRPDEEPPSGKDGRPYAPRKFVSPPTTRKMIEDAGIVREELTDGAYIAAPSTWAEDAKCEAAGLSVYGGTGTFKRVVAPSSKR